MIDGAVLRTITLDHLVGGYLANHRGATVINLACGLDTRFHRLDEGTITWYNLDLPEAAEVRRRLVPAHERSPLIAADALDPTWLEQVAEADKHGHVLVIIEGLTMYLTVQKVRALMDLIAAGLPRATVLVEVMPHFFQRHGHERSVDAVGAQFTYGCRSAAEFARTAAPGYRLLHDVPFTSTIARLRPRLAPLMRCALVGALSQRVVVLRGPRTQRA